jgi:transposase
MVGADDWSVTRWKQAYDKSGETALCGKPHPGRKPKLTRRKLGQLAGMLLKGARQYGYATDLWTLSRVAEVIEDHWGVSYHPGHVWKLLLLMNWSCQKPERRARERNEEAIAGWRREDWPRIKKRPKKRAKRSVPG